MSIASRHRLLGLGVVLALSVCGAPWGAAAAEDSLRVAQASGGRRTEPSVDPVTEVEQLAQELQRLSGRFNTLRSQYETSGDRAAGIDLKKRYDEAVYSYLVEDYARAALLYYTLVDRASRETFSDYADAEWYLAESLFLDGNYHPALDYYTRIVQFGQDHPFYVSAVARMVETYGVTNDTEKFEAYYQTYMGQSGRGIPSTPKIDYAFGKSLYLRGEYDRALPILGLLAAGDSTYAPLCEYLIAATSVAKGDLDKAIATFDRLLQRSINTPEQREVEDLAYLGLGRIYLEKGDYEKAIESYRNISRYSSHFPIALYEMSSTYYRMGDTQQALRTLDILLLTSPDSVDAPDLKLRRGLLLQEMKSYTEALDTYERLIAEYTGIKDEFDGLMRDQANVLRYFNELVGTDLSRIDSSLMIPAQAVRFVKEDKQMARALAVARVLREEQSDLIESDRLIQEIEAVLNSSEPRDLVLHIKRVRAEVRRLRDALLIGSERLVTAEYRYIAEHLPASERARLASVETLAAQLPQLSQQLPELERDRIELAEVYEAQIDEVERNTFKLERLVEDLIAQAASIEKYLSYTREQEGLDPDTEQSTRLRLGQERSELEAALTEIDQLLKALSAMKPQDQIERESLAETEKYRISAVARIDKMRQGLKPLRAYVDRPEAARFFASVDESYAVMLRLSAEMEAFFVRLDELEVQEIARIRRELTEEKARVSDYALQVQRYEGEARDVSEKIALASFSAIQAHFSGLILSANVGIIDVYWEKKEAQSEEIDALQEERKAGIQLLQEKFAALRANE